MPLPGGAGTPRSRAAAAAASATPAQRAEAAQGKTLAEHMRNADSFKRTIAQHQQALRAALAAGGHGAVPLSAAETEPSVTASVATAATAATTAATAAAAAEPPSSAAVSGSAGGPAASAGTGCPPPSIFAPSDTRLAAVHVRVRPLSSSEVASAYFPVVHCLPPPRSQTVMYYPAYRIATDTTLDVHSFEFDGNHGPEASNDDVYQRLAGGMVDFVVAKGGLASIFAYGQTGSGKTFTMSAIAEWLLQQLPYDSHRIVVSIVEIHGDTVRDLVAADSSTLVRVFVDAKGSTVVHGAAEVDVDSHELALDVVQRGFASRTTRSTLKNDTSSRSHLVCRISFLDRKTGAKRGEIKLVDLAGSERLSDSKHHDSERLKEAAHINTSLMALKECLRKRSSEQTEGGYLPFRNSKLTMMLKDSLDPQNKQPTKTIMIACLAPTIADVSHSLNTFRYASTLKAAAGEDAESLGSHLKPSGAKSGRPDREPSIAASSKPAATNTPMSWSRSKLERWIEVKTAGKGTLEMLLGKDGDPRLAPSGVFVPTAWKFIYDLPADQWASRWAAHMPSETTLGIRLQYRKLFVTARATAPADVAMSKAGRIESVMLVEDEPAKAAGAPSTGAKEAIAGRQAAMMAKLKAKGEAARKKAADDQDGSVRGSVFRAAPSVAKPTAPRPSATKPSPAKSAHGTATTLSSASSATSSRSSLDGQDPAASSAGAAGSRLPRFAKK